MLNKICELDQRELEEISGGIVMPNELGRFLDVATGFLVLIPFLMGKNAIRNNKEAEGLVLFAGWVTSFYGVEVVSKLTKNIG